MISRRRDPRAASILSALLRAAGSPLRLERIEAAAREMPEAPELRQIMGDAHLLMRRFESADAWYVDPADRESLLEVGLRWGRYRLVRARRDAISSERWRQFLIERALPGISVGGDAERGFFVDERSASEIAAELGLPLREALAIAARRLVASGSVNVAKCYVLARLAGEEELIRTLEPLFQGRASDPRSELASSVPRALAARGITVTGVMQEGDRDDYDPKSAWLWRARRADGREVVLKESLRLPLDWSDPGYHSDEIRALSSLSCPGVAALRATQTVGRHTLAEMDLVEGVEPAGPLEPGEVAAIGASLCETLARIHASGWLYLDLKPANVLWDGARATLVDFGMARQGRAARSLLSTPRRAPPEMALRQELTASADVCSLGGTLFELATGRHPHAGLPPLGVEDREDELMRYTLAALHAEPDHESVPRPLREVLSRALALAPSERPDALAMRGELLRACTSDRRARRVLSSAPLDTRPQRTALPRVIATLGTTTDDRVVARGMAEAGLGLARVNTAYGSKDEIASRIARFREETGLPVMLDLKGRQVRVICTTTREDPATGAITSRPCRYPIAAREHVRVGLSPSSDLPVRFQIDLSQDIDTGSVIRFDNGNIRARVVDPAPLGIEPVEGAVLLEIEEAGQGQMSHLMGVNVPGQRLSAPPLTERDREMLAAGVALGVELYALSFAQSGADLVALHERLLQHGDRSAGLVAKIEEEAGIAALEEIVQAARSCGRWIAIMVARGDLLVEVGPERLPEVQRDLLARCRAISAPSIVATGLLLSMTSAPLPSRAEVCDVAAALAQGADALMLSDETSNSRHPVEAVAMLARLVARYGSTA